MHAENPKEAALALETSVSTILRKFSKQAKAVLLDGVGLPKAVAIDEDKADTHAEK